MKKEEKTPSLTELVNGFVEKFGTTEDPYTAAFLVDNLTYLLNAAGHTQHPDFDFDAAYAKIAAGFARRADELRKTKNGATGAEAQVYTQLGKYFMEKCGYFTPVKGSNQPSQP